MTPERWKKVDVLFHEALALEPDERAALLDQACGDEPDLRAEIESLLSLQSDVESFLESPAANAGDDASTNEDARPVQRLGDFEILRELGRGGMGIVYEACQVSLDRKVALKVLPATLGMTTSAAVRFHREAQAAAKLHHSNIVAVYAEGEQDGTCFYAMELIEGKGLDQIIAEWRQPEGAVASSDPTVTYGASSAPPTTPTPSGSSSARTGSRSTREHFDTIARWVADAADALDYAHKQGVIHRDIKPSNLMLADDGRVRIMDFGLARMLEEPGMTVSGEFLGTPRYMSLEQITAGRAKLDHRTDIYSLGATLYELLTLQPPFPGEHRNEIIAAIMAKEPKRPRRVRNDIPVDLETICLKAIDRDPDRRYRDAVGMADDLRQYLDRRAIAAKPIGPAGRVLKWVRRKPSIAALCAAVLIAVGLIGYFAHGKRAALRQNAYTDALTALMEIDAEKLEPALVRLQSLGVTHSEIQVLRAWLALDQGEFADAMTLADDAIRLAPHTVAGRVIWRWACWLSPAASAQNQARRTILLDELNSLAPVTPLDYLAKGSHDAWLWEPGFGLKLLDEAARLLRGSTAVFARQSFAHLGRAQALEDPHDADLAVRFAQRADALYTGDELSVRFRSIHAHTVAVYVYEKHGLRAQQEQCRADLERLTRELPRRPYESAGNYEVLRWYHYISGNDEEQLRLWREATEKPFPIVARFGASIPFQHHIVQEGLKVLDQSWPQGGDPIADAVRAFYLLEIDGETNRGVDAAYQAEKRHPQSIGPIAVLRLAGKHEDANEMSLRVRQRFFQDPIVEIAGEEPKWKEAILDFNCGELGAEHLIKRADGFRRQEYHAHQQIAFWHLGEGDRERCRDHLQRAVDTNEYTREGRLDNSYGWCRALLARMTEDPAWPPWIPEKSTKLRPEMAQ